MKSNDDRKEYLEVRIGGVINQRVRCFVTLKARMHFSDSNKKVKFSNNTYVSARFY